jgi:6,7-dimethyl-8-ribityllumazine synthase
LAKTIQGHLIGTGKRFAVVAGRFNSFISDRLIEGAVDCLQRHGVEDEAITIIKVPGSFELPMIAAKAALSGRFDAVVCVSALIRGATPHFDHIAAQTTRGISAAGLESGTPVTFGVLTCDTVEQAIERAGTKAGNKGTEAAMAALEMVNLYDQLL